jgi:hypothetical protein
MVLLEGFEREAGGMCWCSHPPNGPDTGVLVIATTAPSAIHVMAPLNQSDACDTMRQLLETMGATELKPN